jgi:hypothetical protein
MNSNAERGHGTAVEETSAHLLSSVVELARRCAGHLADCEAAQHGWRIYHAIDTDIISLYLAPHENPRYADVFGDADDPDTRLLLAQLLGEFILREFATVTPTDDDLGPLLIVPPHDREVGSLIFRLTQRTTDTLKTAQQQMGPIFEQLSALQGPARADLLLKHAGALLDTFDGKAGPRYELNQFGRLRESRLLNLERYDDDADLQNSLPGLNGVNRQFVKIYEEWVTRLRNHAAPAQRLVAIKRDAQVMATLEWTNRQLCTRQRRLVLITGTTGIIRAAKEYRVECGNDAGSFADLFIRHPQAFMADPAFFATRSTNVLNGSTPQMTMVLVDWLNLLLPTAVRGGKTAVIDSAFLAGLDTHAADFGEAVKLIPEKNGPTNGHPRSAWNVLEDWQTQVRNACLLRKIEVNENREQDLLDWLVKKAAAGVTREQLERDLAARTISSLKTLYTSTAWLGRWSRVERLRANLRGIPILRFDETYAQAEELCRKLINMMGNDVGKGLDETALVDISNTYAELAKVDASLYYAHLVHALAFATKGHWYPAKTLCRLALSTVAALPETERGVRRGREAAYLLAVSERRLAKDVNALVQARSDLMEAERREDHDKPRDIRFAGEELGLDVAEVNLDDCQQALRDLRQGGADSQGSGQRTERADPGMGLSAGGDQRV